MILLQEAPNVAVTLGTCRHNALVVTELHASQSAFCTAAIVSSWYVASAKVQPEENPSPWLV